jgi:hypothetical protein
LHPNILEALETGLTYANLYTPPEEASARTVSEIENDRARIRAAIGRVQNTLAAIAKAEDR